jgi:hypothetical protein
LIIFYGEALGDASGDAVTVGVDTGTGELVFVLFRVTCGISESDKYIADSIFCIASVLSTGFKAFEIFSGTEGACLTVNVR